MPYLAEACPAPASKDTLTSIPQHTRLRIPRAIIKPPGRSSSKVNTVHRGCADLRGFDPRGVTQTSALFGFIQHRLSWMFACQDTRSSLKIMWGVRLPQCSAVSNFLSSHQLLPFTMRWLDSHVLIIRVLHHVTLYFRTSLKNRSDGWY